MRLTMMCPMVHVDTTMLRLEPDVLPYEIETTGGFLVVCITFGRPEAANGAQTLETR